MYQDSEDEDDLYGPFASQYTPQDLAHDIDLASDFDESQSDDENDDFNPPIQHIHTRLLRERLGSDKAAKVADVLHYMNRLGLNLPLFLDLVSWGDPDCVLDPKIRYERSALMVSEELPSILSRWHRPPRLTKSTRARAHGAKTVIERFAFTCVGDVIDDELDAIKHVLQCPAEDLSMEELCSLFIEDLVLKLSSPGFGGTPKLWSLLLRLARTDQQRARNIMKAPDLVILSIISQIMFSRSHHHSRFAKMITVFLRSQGTPAKSIDLLHSFGITMSHQWSVRALKTISQNEMQVVQDWVHRFPFVITHDNVNIPFRVFSQRINNQSHFDSGTASTVFFQPNAPPEPPLCNRTLQEYRAQGRRTPLSVHDIYLRARQAMPSEYERDVNRILHYLIDSSEFDFATYPYKDDKIFVPLLPVNQLPIGERYITRQFMLGTEHLEEASYEGNANVMTAVLHQLCLDSEEEMKKTGLDRVVVWVGDQLTSARLRGLFNFRAQDRNSFERLDWLVPTFGWFHLLMAFANSLHKQYLGTTAGRGLMHAFTLLERQGLTTVQTRGPFHQNLHDAIYHVSEAHFRACWKVVGDVESLEALRSQSPSQLYDLAKQIVDTLASSAAIDAIDALPEAQHDHTFHNAILWNRDVLRYIDLYEATKSGDVGILEASLSHLAFRFAGGRNSNYLGEVLELLQCLHHEWPPELCDFVRRRCWLINMTGQPGKFLPLDKRQEYNVKAVKVTDHVQGPNASWDILKARSPAIPTLQAVRKHLEHQVRALCRGVSHTDPSHAKDVSRLEDAYTSSNIHIAEGGRVVRMKADIVHDITTQGAVGLATKNMLARWWTKRDFLRATSERW